MNCKRDYRPGWLPGLSRREALLRASMGFGILPLADLLAADSRRPKADRSGVSPPTAGAPRFEPRVRSVIFCYMSGGLSHIDSFDPKPRLKREAGRPMPFRTERTMFNQDGNIMPSPWRFRRYGESGIPVSELFPRLGRCADELTVIRSMTARFMEHAQANFYFHCGMPFSGYPSVGAWVTYGLGSENRNLPGFVVLGSGGIPLGGINMFASGFLPAVHQGAFLYPERTEPIRNVRPRSSPGVQRRQLEFVDRLDRGFLGAVDDDPQVEAAIQNYEIAYRMQRAAPDLVDLSRETRATRRLYGLESGLPATASYGRQ